MENIVRKGEIACNKQFLLFSMFSALYEYETYFSFYIHFKITSAISLNLDQSEILLSVNGLINEFGDFLMLFFCMVTECLTLFQEARTETGRNNPQPVTVGIFYKCKPIISMGQIENMRILDK